MRRISSNAAGHAVAPQKQKLSLIVSLKRLSGIGRSPRRQDLFQRWKQHELGSRPGGFAVVVYPAIRVDIASAKIAMRSSMCFASHASVGTCLDVCFD